MFHSSQDYLRLWHFEIHPFNFKFP